MVRPSPEPSTERAQRGWLIGLTVLFGLALVVARRWRSDEDPLYFLVWNLFLAAVPLALSRLLRRRAADWPALPFAALLAAWLLFFPNAPYLLTDLFHLGELQGAPLWYDLAALLTFAWAGLMLGFLSLEDVEGVLERRFGRWVARVAVAAALLLGSFGIYVGRYLRFNSWDVLASPFALWRDLLAPLLAPLAHPGAWGMTLVFFVFLLLAYRTVLSFGR